MAPQLTEGLTLGGVVVRPPWTSFEEAVRGLVHELATSGHVATGAEEQAVRAVLERESIGSTAVVEIGVSIPHARVNGVTEVVAGLAVSPTAVYYAMAHIPITIMALVLSPPSVSGAHLSVLSSLSMLLQSAPTRRRLQQAANAAEVDASLKMAR